MIHIFLYCSWTVKQKIGDVSGGNCFIYNHNLSQQYCDTNNGDMSIGNAFINIHTLSQIYLSSTFKDMDGDVEQPHCLSTEKFEIVG